MLSLLVVATAVEPTPIRLGLEWFLNPDHLPLVVGLKEGIFAAHGLNVTLVEPADHWEAEQEILAGRLDVAVTETLHLVQDAAAGKPVLGFTRFLHTDGGVMYMGGKNISRPRDMCGATISYPGAPGPGGPAIVQTMVEADGGSCDVASYGKHNGGFFHTDALMSGAADVATLIFYNFEIVEARSRGLDASFFSLKEWGVPDFCQLVLFTTPERFAILKHQLRHLVLAMRSATGIVQREPERAQRAWVQFVAERAPPPKRSIGAALVDVAARLNPFARHRRAKEARTERETMAATLPAFPNDNSLSADYFTGLMSWLVRTGQVASSAVETNPPSTYWTNEVAL